MLHVELDTYSMIPNPTWFLSQKEESVLLDRVTAQPDLIVPVDQGPNRLGYRGFIITLVNENEGAWSKARRQALANQQTPLPNRFRIGIPHPLSPSATKARDETVSTSGWLNDTAGNEVDDYLRSHAEKNMQSIQGPQVAMPTSSGPIDDSPSQQPNEEIQPEGLPMRCKRTYVDPNDLRSPLFAQWNNGSSTDPKSAVSLNNAYNFGTATLNKTIDKDFSFPGRASCRTEYQTPLDTYEPNWESKLKDRLRADGWDDQDKCISSDVEDGGILVIGVFKKGPDYHFVRVLLHVDLLHGDWKLVEKIKNNPVSKLQSFPHYVNNCGYEQLDGKPWFFRKYDPTFFTPKDCNSQTPTPTT